MHAAITEELAALAGQVRGTRAELSQAVRAPSRALGSPAVP